jgi:hypothetical protein
LALETAQRLHRGQALRQAGIRFARFANGGEKFAILQLDAVRRDIDLRHFDGIVLAVQQFIVACDLWRSARESNIKETTLAVTLRDGLVVR